MRKISPVSYMKLGYGAGFVNVMFNPKLTKLKPEAVGAKINEAGRAATVPYLESMRDELAAPLGAKTAIAEINRLIETLKKGTCSASDMLEKHNSIYSRMEDEIAGTHFLFIIPNHQSHFDLGSELFGTDVASKFPSLAHDIGEAGKCLALERATASAFHSLRCLEAAIRAMSRCLALPDPTKGSERNWGAMLRHMAAEMDKRWPKGGPTRMSGDGQLFEDGYAALAAMQNPWRNATMHLEQIYTLDEAEHLLRVVGNFLQRLARRMDEDGTPNA